MRRPSDKGNSLAGNDQWRIGKDEWKEDLPNGMSGCRLVCGRDFFLPTAKAGDRNSIEGLACGIGGQKAEKLVVSAQFIGFVNLLV